jgi:hypothetical protein
MVTTQNADIDELRDVREDLEEERMEASEALEG